MDLAPSDEQVMVRDMVRRFLADRYDATNMAKASISRGDWEALGELGVLGFLLPEDAGGMAGAPADVMIVAEEMGRAFAITPFAESVILCGRAITGSRAAERWAEPLVQGKALLACARGGELTEGRLSGSLGIVREGMDASAFVIVLRSGEGVLVEANAPGVHQRLVRLVDGSIAADLHFEDVPTEPLAVSPDQLGATIVLAELAVVAELVGAMATLLDLTVDYVQQRHQFGKPIGSFQVVQHRCARLYTLLEQSRSLLLKAALVEESARARAVTSAKAYICDAALMLAEDSVQLHGGMGVTDELAVGRGLRRVLLLSRLYGGGIAARAALAA